MQKIIVFFFFNSSKRMVAVWSLEWGSMSRDDRSVNDNAGETGGYKRKRKDEFATRISLWPSFRAPHTV